MIGLGLMVMMMLFIWAKQETILYVPSQPIQFIEQNPKLYKSPHERGMEFTELKLKSSDGLKLQGWFLYQKEDP